MSSTHRATTNGTDSKATNQINDVTKTESNTNSDTTESSPFFTQTKLSGEQLIDHALFNMSLNDCDTTKSTAATNSNGQSADDVDGFMRGNRENNYISDCMLQSVDLADSSLSSSPMNAATALHNFWHGNVESSTDTLVPVIESHPHSEPLVISPSTFDDLPALPAKLHQDHDQWINGAATMGFSQRNGDFRTRHLPDVHQATSNSNKAKSTINGHSQALSDNEHQRTSASAYINGMTNANLNAFNATMPSTIPSASALHRRRRNSSNSRPVPLDMTSPNGGLPRDQRSTNGRYG